MQTKGKKMAIWYEASLDKVNKVEVERETKNFIVLKGNRFKGAKDSNWSWFRPTFIEAKQCLIDKKIKKIVSVKDRLKSLEFELEKIKQLKEEDCV